MIEKPVTPEKKDSNKKYLIIIAVLAVLTIVFGILYFTSHTEVVEKTESISSLEIEQLQLKNDLQEMLIQYDTITVNNDRLSAEIMGQQEQIKELLKQMEKHKDDAYIISKLKKEAGTLRDIMKGYLVTIDSLNTMNIDLKKDNQFLAEELSETKTRAQSLETTKKDLEQIVATGSILQANGMTSVGIRVRNNGNQTEVNRANKTELIKTCTEIGENRISPKGKKNIFLRIISPDGVVLDSNDGEDSRFDFNGVSGKYSVKRQIDYENAAMELCIFYTVSAEAELQPGKYIVEMYEAGTLIGKADFDLK
ncbi:hypothetical protein G3O08_00840 [Cryomorpha ignava]|uniref:Chromosome partitioning protein ParA n=1 Tax=Cryomorpha ignava TaxID=101383 RepID=A0A7K3WK89_9FLAO|nr:hypothetical protein [Cryomorpha ignava]NEN22049.1 hypothetical protein [Cryomorpha ignava]